jgi:phosphoribosylamine---glycine ligase
LRIIIVGSGGREHAIAWKLLQSDQIEQIFCVPGNGGTALLPKCKNIAMAVEDIEGILRFALGQGVAFTFVGPEVPLALGIVDAFRAENAPIFGPDQTGAQIESSKAWAKALMVEAGIPTASYAVFDQLEPAIAHLQSVGAPIVIKDDGLAAGKGVTVAITIAEAEAAIRQIFLDPKPNQLVVIEQFLTGEEVSVLAITDGKTIRALLPAQDHKRILDGDRGENTGGMGAYSPCKWVTSELMSKIETEILQPTLSAIQSRGIDYRGCLYAGLIISPTGEPKVIEFNCRFGDPETQTILPLLESDLAEIILACIEQKLDQLPKISWLDQSSVCVVMAAGGYPGNYEINKFITGIGKAESKGGIVFHAGTKIKDQTIFTAGGRVLGVTAIAKDLESAIAKVYDSIKYIEFESAVYRRDIGKKGLNINV